MRSATLKILLVIVTALSGITLSQPITFGGEIKDVAYDGQLYVLLPNGTMTAYSDGKVSWKLTFEGYGIPALITPAPPYGLLVLTDATWLGLIARDGRPVGWVKISVDPNAVARGLGKLLYSNGLALIYAGKTASVVKLPELKPLAHFSLRNSFLGGSISPHGDLIMLYGFDTLCSICIQNEDKTVLVIKLETGDQIYRGVITNLKDATMLWRRNWLVLARWDAMYVYDLGGEGPEKPVRVYAYTHPIDKWLSWGFSPSGNLFHYVFAEGDSLSLVVIDMESGSIVRKNLPIAPGRCVLSSLDDSCRLAAISFNTLIEAAYVLFGEITGEMLVESVKELGTPKAIKIAGDRAVALFSGGFLLMPQLSSSAEKHEDKALALLSVKVVDERGEPYQGALVCVNASCATTSLAGTATLTLEEGTYTLTVRHSSAREFQTKIQVQGNVTKLITLERLFTLNVNISSDEGALRGCSIRVYGAHGSKLGETNNCTVVFTLTRGVYTIEAETARHKITQITTVQSDSSLHFFIVTENEKAIVNVSAFDENGTFLPDAVIGVLDSRNVTLVSAQGRLSSQLHRGRYTIRVQRPGYMNWSSMLELNGSLSLEVKLARIQLTGPAERELNWAIVAAASAVSSLATAAFVVTVYRFKLVSRLGKQISQTRLKHRTRRR